MLIQHRCNPLNHFGMVAWAPWVFSDFRSKNLTKNVSQSKHLQLWYPETDIFTNFFLSYIWSKIGALDLLELPNKY